MVVGQEQLEGACDVGQASRAPAEPVVVRRPGCRQCFSTTRAATRSPFRHQMLPFSGSPVGLSHFPEPSAMDVHDAVEPLNPRRCPALLIVCGQRGALKNRIVPVLAGPSLDVRSYISRLYSYLRYGGTFEQLALPEGTDGPKPVGGLTGDADHFAFQIRVHADPKRTGAGQAPRVKPAHQDLVVAKNIGVGPRAVDQPVSAPVADEL
jgi:hypothetical protein